jgi:D-2-hydroxyacid dehydrogenase (NADP+)
MCSRKNPFLQTTRFWKLPNVIITPHISGNTPFYDQRALALFSDNLQRYLEGLPLHNQLSPQRGLLMQQAQT